AGIACETLPPDCAERFALTGRPEVRELSGSSLAELTAAAVPLAGAGSAAAASLRKKTAATAMTTPTPSTSPSLASLGISRRPPRRTDRGITCKYLRAAVGTPVL